MEGVTVGPGRILEEPEGKTRGPGGFYRGWRRKLGVLGGPVGVGGGD